jgi:cbb3-type cytochrome oxidase subunit 3
MSVASISEHLPLVRGLMTALLLVAFVAICAYAYSARRRTAYEALARLPLEEDAGLAGESPREQP